MGSSYRRWGRPSYRALSSFGFGYGISPVVKQLILINAAVFFLLLILNAFSPALYVKTMVVFGVVPYDVVYRFRIWQLLTYLFLHGGFLHIFFNMFALWMFGTPLERDWGGRRFLRFYLLTGMGAGAVNVVVSLLWGGRAATIPTIGASGAIYAVLLAFGLLYPKTPIYIWFLFPVPARIFVLIFGALTFVSALQGPGTGVSHVSHLGGMFFGYLYLRGGVGGTYRRLRRRYLDWRLGNLQRKFEVYMREQDEKEQHDPGDHWVN